MDLIALTVSFLCGAALAGAGMWIYFRQKTSQPLSELQAEHNRLKDELTDHFVRTSEKVEELSESYRAVMDELRDGATQLVDEETLIDRLGEDRARRLLLEKSEQKEQPSKARQDEISDVELVEPPRY